MMGATIKNVRRRQKRGNKAFEYNKIICGNSEEILHTFPTNIIDLSFWSPPYHVGKLYEKHLDFDNWKDMLNRVIVEQFRVIRKGGFMVVNIGDILCFSDPNVPRIQADDIKRKKVQVTKNDILKIKKKFPHANRYELAKLMNCSEQTIQRRLENNNVRGGKSTMGTKVLLTSAMIVKWAEATGFFLYDKRIWHKDPTWMNSKWHSISYKAVDEYENILVFWKPGITEYDRTRLDDSEWGEWGSRGVWNIHSVRRNNRHEAEFPEELARRVILLFSPKNGLVLDPFVGSGTTTVVAKQQNRKYIGIDIKQKYTRMARSRTNGCQ